MTHHVDALTRIPSSPHGARRSMATLALAATVALLLAPAAALAHPAHAIYHSSIPAPNQILKAAPSLVTIHFAETVNPQGSDIVVYDATGKQVSTAPAQVSRTDLKTMTVPMRGTDAEIYLVVWHNVSADDGDPDTGAFNFLVNPSAATRTAVVGTGGPGDSGSPGMPIWLGIVLALAGLVVGAGGAWYATTRGLLGAAAARR
ncbi:MAG TPA: copper resistance CopC family protein [Ktedonobacterales bacterium]|nr:copper resistance CopC family protein [Ktedonobacterales bacterium]